MDNNKNKKDKLFLLHTGEAYRHHLNPIKEAPMTFHSQNPRCPPKRQNPKS